MKNGLILGLLFSGAALALDPMANQQWGLDNQGQRVWRSEGNIRREEVVGIKGVDARWPGEAALKDLGNGTEVIVAVIDSGLDMSHPEFADRLYKGKDFLDDAAMIDDMGHGTHVAGIIAANADGVGTQGLTPKSVKILPLKVLNQKVQGFVYKKNPNDPNDRGRVITDIIADAIAFAIQSKASVINMSLGWPQLVNSPRVMRALDLAAEKGVLIVAGSGNNNKDVPVWPCSHPTVLCVGAMDNQGKLTEFSNHGGKVDLVAPGEWIVSTNPRTLESRTLRVQGYEAKNGSSQAAPFVTAAAALLKLQDPTLTAQGIKAKLYASARPLEEVTEQRFVRFGSLSITDALKMAAPKFATVSVKGLTTVSVGRDGNYDFSLPLEIFGESEELPVVKISGLAAKVQVSDKVVRITGRITDLRQDSEVSVKFTTTFGGKTVTTPVTLSMARQLESSELISVELPQIAAASLMSIQGERKLSKVGYVAVEDRPTSDFHFYTVTRQGVDVKVTDMRVNADGSSARIQDIVVKDYQQLLSVFEKDINLDGKNDLVFYGINTKKDGLVLTFTTIDGDPLFGANSRWEMPITTLEGLPLKEEGARVDFSWIKHKSFLGEVLLPYYQKAWQMPEEDNSTELLYREQTAVDMRLYYWEPTAGTGVVKLRPRVVDSVAFKRQLRASVNIAPWETLSIERLLPQSQAEKARGTVRQLVSVGEGFFRRFSILTLKSTTDSKLTESPERDAFLTGNTSLPTRSLTDFSFTADSFQMALLDRSSARIKPMVEGETLAAWSLRTSGWSNPFFEVVATFQGEDRRTLFFESRYHVYVYDQGAVGAPGVHRLPINRESSFPGVSFSETLQAALVRDGEQNLPAVAINSMLIYGDRFYSMVSSPESLTRPLALSIKTPANCVPLRGQILAKTLGHSAYAMLCQDADGSATVEFFPLVLK